MFNIKSYPTLKEKFLCNSCKIRMFFFVFFVWKSLSKATNKNCVPPQKHVDSCMKTLLLQLL